MSKAKRDAEELRERTRWPQDPHDYTDWKRDRERRDFDAMGVKLLLFALCATALVVCVAKRMGL